MIDLDELERLHKAATDGKYTFERSLVAHVIGGDKQDGVAAAFIRAIKNACDDGLLQRLRTAERERDEADRKAGAAERKLEHLEDRQRKADAWMRERKAEVGVSESAPFDDAWATLASERAALKAENERLREELRVTEETSHAFISSFNPHELPSGKEDQWHASIEQCRRARTALETTNG